MLDRKEPIVASHTHDMKPDVGKIWKCSSCLFRCTQSSLSTVRTRTREHRIIKRGDPQASTVWSAPQSSSDGAE
jgi:hypothetical protein